MPILLRLIKVLQNGRVSKALIETKNIFTSRGNL